MHYFSLITEDYCDVARIGVESFFRFNDVTLNLYVIDKGYLKVKEYYKDKEYSSKLNIIDAYNEELRKIVFALPHNCNNFDTHIAHTTLLQFYVFDLIPDDECVRVDLDVLYFGSLQQLASITDVALCGVQESKFCKLSSSLSDPDNHTPEVQINVGICKFNKHLFNIDKTFTNTMLKVMEKDAVHYLIPEQDLLNEIATSKRPYTEQTIITNYNDIDQIDTAKPILAFHFNGTYTKPWVSYCYNEIYKSLFVFACGVLVCKAFADKYDYFRQKVYVNTRYTEYHFKRTLTQEQMNLYQTSLKLVDAIKEW